MTEEQPDTPQPKTQEPEPPAGERGEAKKTRKADAAGEAKQGAAAGSGAKPASPPRPGKRGVARAALVIAVLALLAALGTGAGGYYGWRRLQAQFADQAAARGRVATQVTALENTAAALQSAMDRQAKAQAREVGALKDALAAVRERLGRDHSGWVLANAEYLLLIANHRLRLERDIGTAVAALQAADERLRATGDPALIDVREKIASEIAALKAVPRPDITGLALELTALGAQVDKLPLLTTYQPPPSHGEPAGHRVQSWKQLPAAIWTDIKGLITVRRQEQVVRPMLPPKQQYFLRLNVRLQLAAARLALLQGDVTQLHAALTTARDWVGRYFDPKATATASLLSDLQRIEGVDIRPQLPDISASLDSLRAFMRTAQQRGPAQ